MAPLPKPPPVVEGAEVEYRAAPLLLMLALVELVELALVLPMVVSVKPSS